MTELSVPCSMYMAFALSSLATRRTQMPATRQRPFARWMLRLAGHWNLSATRIRQSIDFPTANRFRQPIIFDSPLIFNSPSISAVDFDSRFQQSISTIDFESRFQQSISTISKADRLDLDPCYFKKKLPRPVHVNFRQSISKVDFGHRFRKPCRKAASQHQHNQPKKRPRPAQAQQPPKPPKRNL